MPESTAISAQVGMQNMPYGMNRIGPSTDGRDAPSSPRARQWKLRTQTLELSSAPLIVGIVNVTPDSFSDGGQCFDPHAAIDRGLKLVEDGANILDVGGESTRPYADPVDPEEELRRVEPVIAALCRETSVPVSIDTSKSSVARRSLEVGAEIINDITGLEGDPDMVSVAQDTGAAVCAMHMQGTPKTMQDAPDYSEVVEEILEYLRQRRDQLSQSGVDVENICLDPGIGFGKTHEHNITLLSNCYRFHELGCPVLVGHSRKGFIKKILGDNANVDAGTIGVALSLARQGIQLIRVHNVRAVKDALEMFRVSGGIM